MLARGSTMVVPLSKPHVLGVIEERGRAAVALTPNFLKPLILSSCWSCISTSDCADTSSDEGSSTFFAALFRGILPIWAGRRVLLDQSARRRRRVSFLECVTVNGRRI